MAKKNEQRTKYFSSVDDWLDEKQRVEGAEGLWRIHDKLYDFTLWSRTHPGGKFWLDITRGTDITEAFESLHFSNKAESLLSKYYIREALTPRKHGTTFCENEFYKVFKRKALSLQLTNSNEPSLCVQLITDGLTAIIFITGLLGVNNGIVWAIISGLFLGILSVTCHSFLHMKDHWRAFYFNLSLMSCREWKIRHVLSHHQYRGTEADLERPMWQPFFGCPHKIIQPIAILATVLLFLISSHVQFLRRCLDVFLSKKLGFHSEELVLFSFLLFLFFFNRVVSFWHVFATWNLIILIGSFVFCFISSCSYKYKHQEMLEKNSRSCDFGIAQLSLMGSHPEENKSVLSFLNAFRVLHYLCPTLNSTSLSKLIPAFREALNEHGISYSKNNEEFLQDLQNTIPQVCN